MKPRVLTCLASATLYTIALFTPAFAFAEGDSSFILGMVCLLFGWGKFAWYANPILLAAYIAFLKKKDVLTTILSVAALAVAATTLSIEEVPRNSSGTLTRVVGYGLGFYFWLASMAVLFAAGIHRIVVRRRADPTVDTAPSRRDKGCPGPDCSASSASPRPKPRFQPHPACSAWT
ncbi:MAG: hypothetical protein KF791_08850 [Verrucomicrobiae bacterium]|nr:hypothetical protein [Verrucomicrobiae bacterium]